MFNKLNNLRIFFEEPSREFNVREVARLLRISPATASKRLHELARESILKERTERLYTLYRANLESDSYRDLKVYYIIRKIKESGFLEALNRFYLRPTIILFGSAASGLDTETSDLDIVIISEKKQDFPEQPKFEKKVRRKIQLFVVKEVKELNNKHLINNVLNGIKLQGEIKWI